MKITLRQWSSFGCFKSVLNSREIAGLCILLASLSGLIIFHMIVLRQASTLSSEPNTEKRVDNMCTESELKRFPNGTVDFRGFNNYTGYKSGCYVVSKVYCFKIREQVGCKYQKTPNDMHQNQWNCQKDLYLLLILTCRYSSDAFISGFFVLILNRGQITLQSIFHHLPKLRPARRPYHLALQHSPTA